MNDTVVKLSQLGGIPAAGGTYEVAGDALELVDVVAAAVRTGVENDRRVMLGEAQEYEPLCRACYQQAVKEEGQDNQEE